MGHARCNLAVKLLIRPVLRAGPAPGDDERTSHKKDTPQRSVKTRVTFASPSAAAEHNFGSAAHRILTVNPGFRRVDRAREVEPLALPEVAS